MPGQTVTVLKTFIDRENGMKERKPGEHFSTSPDRAKYLEILGACKSKRKAENSGKNSKTDRLSVLLFVRRFFLCPKA